MASPCGEDVTYMMDYTHWTGGGGHVIPNTEETRYGYITECGKDCADGYIDFGECKNLKGIGEAGDCSEFYEACWPSEKVRVCQRDWDTLYKTHVKDNMACCSTGLDSSRQTSPSTASWLASTRPGTGRLNCHPQLCPTTNICANEMAYQCRVQGWGPYCDKYTRSAPEDKARKVVQSYVNGYLTNNGPDSGNLQDIDKIASLCKLYPGVCDDLLLKHCSSFSRNDLTDPSKGNLWKLCGCFLPSKEYEPYEGMAPTEGSVACLPPCLLPDTIKKAIPPSSNDNGGTFPSEFEQCRNTNCIMDEITIRQIESNTNTINIEQVCTGCPEGKKCICHVPDVEFLRDVNSKIEGGYNLSAKCDVCLADSEAYPQSPTIIPCGQESETEIKWKGSNAWRIIIIASIGIVVSSLVIYCLSKSRK